MSGIARLLHLLGVVAEDLEHRRLQQQTGVIRLARQVIVELNQRVKDLEAELAHHRRQAVADDGCPACGGEVLQPARGRRRVYCSDGCRKRQARRKGRNGEVAA